MEFRRVFLGGRGGAGGGFVWGGGLGRAGAGDWGARFGKGGWVARWLWLGLGRLRRWCRRICRAFRGGWGWGSVAVAVAWVLGCLAFPDLYDIAWFLSFVSAPCRDRGSALAFAAPLEKKEL